MNTTRDMSDGQIETALLAAYAAGDAEAARRLMLRFTPRLFGLALRMLGDRAEAEDVAQETMLRLWQAAPGWEDRGVRPLSWCYRVAGNLCTDRLRRRRPDPLEPEMDPPDPAPSASQALQGRARMAALDAALMQLPERQRLAVILRHIEDRSNPEIAEILEISVDAVESLTARGKRALAGILSGQREALGYTDDR